ncbi:hypothetical protein LEP1GSC053_2051 [Leptospira interrogans serovar Muenchen str. Brem 129]|nr:hypothetical protein LEP1GSC057_3613 [Leptospira interrogans str. Brem 329]EKR16825.1 hypothetical protein LEP1GSC019_2710 [Leptospira interrogans serovar Pyrogenes str. 2006006960]EMN08733.1 hypothetical protein LEP1GSC053_2051 [Leptospira interrogans serovar Muenchen str. Brem 129]
MRTKTASPNRYFFQLIGFLFRFAAIGIQERKNEKCFSF